MKTVAIFLLLTLLVSCNVEQKQPNTTTDAFGTTDGKFCNDLIVSEINTLSRLCDEDIVNDRASVLSCIYQAESIKKRFPNLECKLNDEKSKTVVINNEEVLSIQNKFTRANYLNFENGETCGQFFIDDLSKLTEFSCKGFDLTSKSDITICLNDYKEFNSKYPIFNCKIVTDQNVYTYDTES